jgi:protein-L-isoaspartate(D-aspartate) O-methyltransferase
MTDKPARGFPLPLSSVTAPGGTGRDSRPRIATPQTATQNAASLAQRVVPRPVASAPGPGRAHALAAQRSQPAVPAPPRADLLVSDAIRQAMVARIVRQGVRDPAVLAAMQAVPRHAFIDPALSAQAYVDASLPIGHHQTISQPYIVARMIEVLRNGAEPGRVLEIGTGCGYQAAVLACVAREVYSIERIKPLHELAKTRLRPLRIPNLRLHYGDGMLGLPQAAPFDGIILAAAGMQVPQALLDQLAIGGRLVAPVGGQVQHLQLTVRVGRAEWSTETLEACHFVPLRPGVV